MPPAHLPTGHEVDVRGPRAAAWVPGAVLAVATGLALVAALLHAATGSCPGRQLHPTVRRARPARTA
ncbi:hypothetical protein ACU610_17320 [Geodermatophilus sp. URMC 61]|uniref:hypothetical protein n=1 Tax=Geodermatophilus sp. URMC 61 TaxID=3423411 RepID=UPI00406CFE37